MTTTKKGSLRLVLCPLVSARNDCRHEVLRPFGSAGAGALAVKIGIDRLIDRSIDGLRLLYSRQNKIKALAGERRNREGGRKQQSRLRHGRKKILVKDEKRIGMAGLCHKASAHKILRKTTLILLAARIIQYRPAVVPIKICIASGRKSYSTHAADLSFSCCCACFSTTR